MTNVTRTSLAQLAPGGHWRNWVGNQSFIARHKAEPGSEDELAALVREASRQSLSIRVAGSGHSFTPIVATSGLLLSLTNMQGLVRADLHRKRVVVRAGTRIGGIGRALKEIGLSLANQGAPRRSPEPYRPARMGRESDLAASRPRPSACGWFSRTGPFWTSTPTRTPKRWRLRRFPSAHSA